MPDTFFTASPEWGWLIVLYFFIGGITGGSLLIAGLLYFFGRPEDRPVVRLAYYVAFVGALLSGALLTLDLTRPLRFWHMLIQANTGAPMFKLWAPMSVGSWGVLLVGLFSFLGALAAFGEERGVAPLRALGRGVPGALLAALGSLFGLFLAGYTGVLTAVTNRPLWADSQLLGVLFLVSGVSTAAAALLLLSRRHAAQAEATTQRWLAWFDRPLLVLELVLLIAFVISLGSVARVLLGWWGLLLLLGVVIAGLLLPLALERREWVRGVRGPVMSAALVLLGGLLLRVVVIFSSEAIHVTSSGAGLP